MLNNIIAFSIKNKFIISIMTLVLIIWGGWSAATLPIDAVPDITNNQVQIITVCPTLAGQEVERLVTYPIEQSMANLPNLEELRSVSRFGLSVITVVFEDDVDIYFARQLINERLLKAKENIPNGVGTPELAPVSTGLGEVYQYIIHPKEGSENKYTAMDLRTMQDWIVARQLYGTHGVAEVNSFGGQLKLYEVAVNPNQLVAMDVTISDLFNALERNNENTGGAYIDKKPNAYFIRSIGLIQSFEDIENIVVKTNPKGIPILIKDVGKVHFGSAVRFGAMTYNGEVDAVGGIVMMLKGENSAEVVSHIKNRMALIQKSLPDDVIIEPFLDRTDLVNRAISTVETNLIEGALIVIFVLVIFLGNLRAGLIVASAIPLSMLFALGLMKTFGVSANLMSLGAIDFGLIVDGAVIIVEATLHHLGLRKGIGKLSQKEMDEEVFKSSSKIRNSAAFGEIIILIVYLPILTLVGIEGKMFAPMAQTVGFAIIGALILSLTYIPMMCAKFLPKTLSNKKSFSDKMMESIYKRYSPALDKVLKFKYIVLGTTIVAFGVAVFTFLNMGGEFIPKLQEGDYAFHCILPQGTSLSQSVETSMQAMRIIKEFDEVKMVVGKTGSAEVPTDPMPPEATDMMIILKAPEDWKRDITYTQLADEIMHELSIIPGAFFEINQPIQMRFNELMTGIRQDVAIKIFGENMDTLIYYADEAHSLIQNIRGASEPSVEKVDGLPQIVIHYNRAQIANYGLNISDINHVISTAFAGGKAGVVFENDRKFNLVIRLDSLYRKSIDDVEHLYISTNNGTQIPLSQVADIKMELGPAQISRENGKRRIVVGFNVKDRDVESIVEEIQVKLDENIELPNGYYYAFGGTFENLQAASKRLMVALPIALALIFILLYFTFSSAKQAVLIFTAIPMSAIGGVLALIVRDMPFSISAGIGFIALFGVAVLNGIVLIGTFNQLEKDGMENILDRIKEGTRIRLRPVLMTAAVASLGFLPMALSHGAGAEVQKPLATVVIGGLITATILTLFVLPILYLLFSKPIITSFKRNKFALIGLAVLGFSSLQAQSNVQKLSADNLVEMALTGNLQVQSKQLHIQSSEALKKSTFELNKTNVNFQYGQYNSYYNDNAFQISQDIPFPTYFGAKSGLYMAELQSNKLQLQATSNEVKAKVLSCYYHLHYLQMARNQLLAIDSLYTEFEEANNTRFQTGEISMLEKSTSSVKRAEIEIDLKENATDIEDALNQLKTLINFNEEFEVQFSVEFSPISISTQIDSASIANNAILQLMYQEAIIAEKSKKLETAAVLPDFSLGYFNQSLIGSQTINGSEVNYSSTDRFQGINLGVAIPLTFFSNASKLKSIEYHKLSLLSAADYEKQALQTELEKAINQYYKNLSNYNFYQNSALQNANVISNTALVGYKNGEISYLEFINAIETVRKMNIQYLNTINALNQTIVHINYLVNQ